MGMRKEKCPKCKRMRPRSSKNDKNPNYWLYDEEVKRGVCVYCQKNTTTNVDQKVQP